MAGTGDQPVAVVTGGGGGIGAAVAEALGRSGHFVVTVDPLVTLDGADTLPEPEETTAGRIIAAGGAARASAVSVTDGDALGALFAELVEERGRLDAVVNVAGITRPTSFTSGTDADWHRVLSVHLDGYLNVLSAALPVMAAAGRGRILGVTSGSGWRPADTGAYGCAKRAVASLTWQLGSQVPAGVTVNAMSPIAVTRMVTAALGGRAGGRPPGSASAASGGLSLGSMPQPEEIGPMGAHLAGEGRGWCNGQVIFVGGPEVAVVDRPRLLEVFGTDATSLGHLLDSVGDALAAAEAAQATPGGSNPRFPGAFDDDGPGSSPAGPARHCLVVSDRPDLAAAVVTALAARGIPGTTVNSAEGSSGFEAPAATLAGAAEHHGPLAAVVVALTGSPPARSAAPGWETTLTEHADVVDQIHNDAGWARAVADHARTTDRPLRLVQLTDATTAGGRTRAQAAAQHARSAWKATGQRVAVFPVSVEVATTAGDRLAGELTAHLLARTDGAALSGAELVVGRGWFGLRGHPRPSASITIGGPAVPDWFDDTLRSIVR
jgi:NAD(P)-dependent dehydrogenase (short-subunit alcohol dehydrogenase family)